MHSRSSKITVDQETHLGSVNNYVGLKMEYLLLTYSFMLHKICVQKSFNNLNKKKGKEGNKKMARNQYFIIIILRYSIFLGSFAKIFLTYSERFFLERSLKRSAFLEYLVKNL